MPGHWLTMILFFLFFLLRQIWFWAIVVVQLRCCLCVLKHPSVKSLMLNFIPATWSERMYLFCRAKKCEIKWNKASAVALFHSFFCLSLLFLLLSRPFLARKQVANVAKLTDVYYTWVMQHCWRVTIRCKTTWFSIQRSFLHDTLDLFLDAAQTEELSAYLIQSCSDYSFTTQITACQLCANEEAEALLLLAAAAMAAFCLSIFNPTGSSFIAWK